ncbi:MAG: STAS domain-containing protein [Acidobacteriota bacterium]
MFITERKIGKVKVIELNGRIDATCDHFAEDLQELVGQEENVLVDCANLNYINSAGLRAFLSVLKSRTKAGSKLHLCCLSADVLRVFEVSGFLALFKAFPSRDEALESF